MATQASLDKVQQFYVAYYGRPADPTGQEAWADLLDANGGDLTAIIDAFGTSPEADERFGGQTSAETIETLYQQLFGRSVETQEVQDAWVFQLENNPDVTLQSIAVDLLTAALNDDKAVIDNKTAVANNFTAALDTQEEIDAYVGTAAIAAGNTLLNAVDATTDTDAVDVAAPIQQLVDDANTGTPGGTFTLTTGVDVIESVAGNDTITGTDAQLAADDLIVDASTEDNDTLNLTVSTATDTAAATITNVENINVDLDVFAGSDAGFAATNVTGATITLSSDKLGFDGTAEVNGAAANTVVAGTNVTDLTVAGLTTGTVDAGSATTVTITATNDSTVVVNGDVDVAITAATDDVTINATAASDVDLATSATDNVEVTGAVDVVLSSAEVLAGEVITNSLTAGTLTASIDTAAGAVDADEWGVDTISADVDTNNNTLTVASGANVVAGVAQTSMAIDVAGTGTSDEVNLSTGFDHGTDLTFTGVETANITVTDEVTIDDLIIGDKATLAGSHDVTVTTSNADEFDASAFTGELTYTTSADADILGGTGANNVTVGAATVVAYTGQGGVDTIDATALLGGTLAAETGAGNDIVNFDANVTGVVALDGGTGTDTVNVGDSTNTATDLSNATTWAVNNFEALTVTDAAASAVVAQAVTLTGDQADDFTSLAITGPTTGTSDDTLTLTVNVAAADTSMDLSGLVVADTDAISLVINGTNGAAQTIVGTNASETIDAGTGTASAGNTLTGGAGDEDFVFADGDSTEASMTSITDYQAAAAASDNDRLSIGTTDLVADGTTDVSGVGTIFTGATATVNATVDDGVMTLTGLAGDLAMADTLAEYIDIAENLINTVDADTTTAEDYALAFEFGGNTYVLEFVETGTNDGTYTTESVIELTGTTGISAVSGTAAADTILIA